MLGDALAAAAVTPETAWQNVGGARGIDPSAHAALVALAAWRYRTAVELDRPLGQVLNDKVLIELAKQRPDDEGGVRAQKGMSPIAKTRAKGIVAAIEDATPTKRGPKPAWQPASARARRWSDLLLEIAQLIADDTKIAARLLATRSDAEEFARAVDERGLAAAGDLPALSTWRRDVLGTVWSGFLAGTLQLVGDVGVPHGLRLVPGVARS